MIRSGSERMNLRGRSQTTTAQPPERETTRQVDREICSDILNQELFSVFTESILNLKFSTYAECSDAPTQKT